MRKKSVLHYSVHKDQVDNIPDRIIVQTNVLSNNKSSLWKESNYFSMGYSLP